MKNIYTSFLLKGLTGLMILVLPLMLRAQTISPDHFWHDASGTGWYTDGYGTCTYNYNGLLYVFNYHDNGQYNGAYPYIYTINMNHDYAQMAHYALQKINNFGYQGENYSYHRPPMKGRNMAFQYNGRLWFFQQVGASYTDDMQWQHKDESYQCFAQLSTVPNGTPASYYIKDVYDPAILKYGAFQFDSNLYFISQYTGGNKQFCLEEYGYNSGNNRFNKVREIDLSVITGCNMFSGVFKRLDSLGNEYVVINTYYEGNGVFKIGKLKPGLTSDHKRTFTWSLIADNNTLFPGLTTNASTIAEGTIKGCRTSDPNPTSPDRMVLYAMNHSKSSDGTYHISYREIRWEHDRAVPGSSGEIVLPTADGPSKAGDHYQILASYELKPMDFTTKMSGYDGYQSYIWMLYPDGNHHFNGAQLTSDQWQLKTDSVVISLDLNNDADSMYTKAIHKMWTLIGIVEGPPPVSVNWPQWNTTFPNPTPATVLRFEKTTSNSVEYSTTTEDEWSIGQSVEVGGNIKKKLTGTLGEEFKYSNTYKTNIQSKFDTTITYEIPFELYEEGQEYGYYIYSVPQMKRYSYSLYPWWETTAQHYPIPNSHQYLFRTTGMGMAKVPVLLDSFPYYVENPNSANMAGWQYTNRGRLRDYIETYDKAPCMTLDWDSPGNGNTGRITTATDSVSSYENSNQYEIGGSAGVQYKCPEVFKISVTATANWSQNYTNETTTKTAFENSVSASLENLYAKADGLNLSHLHMNVYMFRPEKDPSLWIYDSLAGNKPWYLAYMVITSSDKITLNSPLNNSMTDESGLLFSWEQSSGSLKDCKMMISSTGDFSKGHVLYEEMTNDRTRLSVPSFHFEKGKTYYWVVRGTSPEGEPVWSSIWSFTINDDSHAGSQDLKAVVYPNPCTGNDIHLLVDSKKAGNVVITLTDINGVQLYQQEIVSTGSVPVNFSFPSLNLPGGIYFIRFNSGDEQVVRKVLIQL